ncbi:MAG: radical SAM protein [Treponema sp.]|nr:radical SAM protein [Treponema sp.]
MSLPRVCLVQPPLVQLNGPYPAPYYLKSFFAARAYPVVVRDHSIGLFERIFCRSGLERIFTDARRVYEEALAAAPGEAVSGPDLRSKGAGYYIRRFLSEADRWLSAVDHLVRFLQGREPEWGHFLALANGVLPGGPRFDACLAASEGNAPGAALLATKLLEDLADFITHTLDPSFSLIRYLPRLAGSPALREFSPENLGLRGYIFRTFYLPFLEEEWDALEEGGTDLILGITIPFPGCLSGALACAGSAKERFGKRVLTIAGGGYVNTELRFLEAGEFFDFFDYLSFDRGYGSLEAVLDRIGRAPEEALYKTRYRSRKTGELLGSPDDRGEAGFARFRETDRVSVKTIFPDYTGVDFSRYLYPVDEENPMHRLWSDGHWLKAYLAHGCYWHGCAFCDVTLDYIRGFEPVPVEALFRNLLDQAEKTGVRAVHLVDEAAPASSLLGLAELNRDAGLPLVFWGNIRFEGAFSPDAAAFLAAGGLLGVSAGIEVASEAGFKRIGKGLGLKEVVRACAAFKEAGILTHAYLIYGYWDEDPQEIIDSAEILRQIFAEGLLDSAFWHKFVLTRHSRIYAERQRGLHPALKVQEGPAPGRKTFAVNDLSFEGEEAFDQFTEPLDRLLAAWMGGSTGEPVAGAFPFKTPPPSVEPHGIEKLLDAYARDRDARRAALPLEDGSRALFLGSRPLVKKNPDATVLSWRWRLADHRLKIPVRRNDGLPHSEDPREEALATLLEEASRHSGSGAAAFYRNLEELLGRNAAAAWKTLRKGGLVLLPGGAAGPK